MNELIPIAQRQIAGELTDTIDARELHAFLGAATAFKDWIARRIQDFGFVEGSDFCSFLSESSGGRPAKEYALTIGMAKELAMVERNEKGKEARLYFIECERRAKDSILAARPPVIVTGDALVSMAIAIRDHQLQAIRLTEEQERLKAKCVALESGQLRLEDGQKAIAARQTALEVSCNEFTVMGYANYREIRIDLATAGKIGKRATAIAKQLGLATGKIRDPRFGIVNSYPEEALEQAFAEIIKNAAL